LYTFFLFHSLNIIPSPQAEGLVPNIRLVQRFYGLKS